MCSGLAANPDYLFIRLLLHLLLLAVRLWVHQASPIHLLWFEGAIWRTALRGGSGGFPRLRAQVNATIPLAAFKTLLCKARNVLKLRTPTQLHKGGKKSQKTARPCPLFKPHSWLTAKELGLTCSIPWLLLQLYTTLRQVNQCTDRTMALE